MKKRKAAKVEKIDELPIQEVQSPQKEELEQSRRKYGGPLGILELFTHENYEW